MSKEHVEDRLKVAVRKDFVNQNALKTHNFDKFWFHFLWVAVLLLTLLGFGLWLWCRR